MRSGSSDPTSGQLEEQSSGDETDSNQDNNTSPEHPAMTFEVEMATEDLASLTSQVEAIVAGASVSTQPTTVTTTPPQ